LGAGHEGDGTAVLVGKLLAYFGDMEGTTYVRHLHRRDDGTGWSSGLSEVVFTDAEYALLLTRLEHEA
jgi:hypothetical protein